jgi:septum site-determining protein MinC
MSKNQARKPLEIKISTVVAVAALLGDTDHEKLSSALAQVTGGTPDYFEDEFTVIDLGNVLPPPAAGSIAWAELIALFRSHRLNPVAVRNAPSALEEEIRAQGLSIDGMEQSRTFELTPPPSPPKPDTQLELAPEPEPEPASVMPAPAAAVTVASTMIIDTPVRSGQRVYARGCDLVVMATVNAGAEVIADGSIHVYAPLRGRALAGASGNGDARIFSTAMEAELVSIGGVYRTFDEGWPKDLAGHPAQVMLKEERLELKAISLK